MCLGLQAIGECFGAKLKNLDRVYHGLATPVKPVADDPVFLNCPSEFNAGRYHSWVVNAENLPAELLVTAVDEQNLIMALRHISYDVRGVQFHPESVFI